MDEIIQETTPAGAGAEARGKDGPNLADNEEQQAAAHRSKEEEEDARKKKEEAEAALGVFLESWLRYRKEDAARKKEEEEDAARKKQDEEDDARKKKKQEAEAAAASEKKNCFSRQLDKLIAIIKEDKQHWEVKKDALEKMREWLMVLVTLAVSIAYSAGLNPPGGMWQDDEPGHHTAGTPVLLTNARPRYLTFYYSNAMSFVMSLVIVALLLTRKASVQALVVITMFDLMFLVVAYLAGTTAGLLWSIPPIVIATVAFLYFAYWMLILVCVGVLVVLSTFLWFLCLLPCFAVVIAADFLDKGRGKPDRGVAVTGSQQNVDRMQHEQV